MKKNDNHVDWARSFLIEMALPEVTCKGLAATVSGALIVGAGVSISIDFCTSSNGRSWFQVDPGLGALLGAGVWNGLAIGGDLTVGKIKFIDSHSGEYFNLITKHRIGIFVVAIEEVSDSQINTSKANNRFGVALNTGGYFGIYENINIRVAIDNNKSTLLSRFLGYMPSMNSIFTKQQFYMPQPME